MRRYRKVHRTKQPIHRTTKISEIQHATKEHSDERKRKEKRWHRQRCVDNIYLNTALLFPEKLRTLTVAAMLQNDIYVAIRSRKPITQATVDET